MDYNDYCDFLMDTNDFIYEFMPNFKDIRQNRNG